MFQLFSLFCIEFLINRCLKNRMSAVCSRALVITKMKFAYFLHRLLIGFIGCGSLHTAKTLKEKIGKTNLYAHVKTVFRIIHISFQKILYTYQKNLLFDINTNIINYVPIV